MAIEKSLIVNPLWNTAPVKHQIYLLNKILNDGIFSTIEIWDTSDADMLDFLETNSKHINFDVSLSILMQKQGVSNCVSSPEQAEQWTTYILERIQNLSQIGISNVSISSPINNPSVDRKKQIEFFKTSIAEICHNAARQNMFVCIEPFDISADKKRIWGTTLEVKKLFEKNKYDNLFLTWDLGHVCLNNEDYLVSLESLLNYIKRIHISNYSLDRNSIFFGDKHLPFDKIGMISENDIMAIMCFLTKKCEGHILSRDITIAIEVATNKNILAVCNFINTYNYICSITDRYIRS